MTCPYKNCGGCDRLDEPTEDVLQDKTCQIAKALDFDKERIQTFQSSATWGYRSRVQLRYHPAQRSIGYFERGRRKLVPIHSCAVAVPEINRVLEWINEHPFVEHNDERFRLTLQTCISNDQTKITASIVGSHGHSEAKDKFAKHLTACPHLTMVANSESQQTEPIPYDHHNGIRYYFLPSEFRQVNMEVNRQIREQVLAQVDGASRVADIYGGSGNLSLQLAQSLSFLRIVESNSLAELSWQTNIKANEINESKVEFEKDFASKAEYTEEDTLILDPPRSGLSSEVIEKILQGQFEKLIYLSCNLDSLSRDYQKLQRGYHLEQVYHYDMMPRTSKIETLAIFTPVK